MVKSKCKDIHVFHSGHDNKYINDLHYQNKYIYNYVIWQQGKYTVGIWIYVRNVK